MKEKQLIGLNKNVAYGLSWILFPIGIVVLACEHARMTKEEKTGIVQIFVLEGILTIIGIVVSIFSSIFASLEMGTALLIVSIIQWAISIPFFVVWLIALIKAFRHDYWHVPVLYDVASSFTKNCKDPEPEAAEVVEEDTKEE